MDIPRIRPQAFRELEIQEVDSLVGRVAMVDLDDPQEMQVLIGDITGLLIKRDTDAKRLYHLDGSLKIIQKLCSACLKDGWESRVQPGHSGRKSLIIHPEGLPNGGKDVNALHVHIDTWGGKEGDGLTPLLEKDGDLLLGVGSCDMKGQVAVAILLLESIRRANNNNLAVIITSDEELGGLFGGQEVWEEFEAEMRLEMEPTGQHPGKLLFQIGDTWQLDLPHAKLKMVLEIIESRGLLMPPREWTSRKEQKQFLTTSKLLRNNWGVALSGKFHTLSTLMGMTNVINIGPAEEGTGRHSGATEGVRLSHLYEVFVIMNQLLSKGLQRF
jgi:hypothetical protein